MPVKCISIPWHSGISLPSTCPAPTWPSSFTESESYSKGSTLCGSEQGQAASLGRSDFRAPSAPSPSKHWPGHCSRLPSWERAKLTCLGRSGREGVCVFGSWKRETCADLGSKVCSLLGHVEAMRGGSFPTNCTATKHFTFLSKGPATEPPGPIPPPSQAQVALEGGVWRRLAAQGSLPSLLSLSAALSTTLMHQRKRGHGLGIWGHLRSVGALLSEMEVR